jgi:hypothetical protein
MRLATNMKRPRFRGLVGKLTLAIVVIALIVFSPLWILFALAENCAYRYRQRSVAKTFRCTGCGVVLGIASLQLADAEWARCMVEWCRQHPGVRARIVRLLHAICSNCGRRYTFLEKDRTFVEEPQD